MKNYFGFDRSDLAYKLLQYPRVGNCNNNSVNYGTSVLVSDTSYSQKFKFDLNVSVFPFLAYKKFCQDYFRYSQWQTSSPYLWNIDYYTGTQQRLFPSLPPVGDSYWENNTIFDLEYCNWNKDLFMGVLPDSQFGDVATIDVGVTSGAASAEVVLGSSSGAAYRPVKTYAALGTSNSHTEITVDDPNTCSYIVFLIDFKPYCSISLIYYLLI